MLELSHGESFTATLTAPTTLDGSAITVMAAPKGAPRPAADDPGWVTVPTQINGARASITVIVTWADGDWWLYARVARAGDVRVVRASDDLLRVRSGG